MNIERQFISGPQIFYNDRVYSRPREKASLGFIPWILDLIPERAYLENHRKLHGIIVSRGLRGGLEFDPEFADKCFVIFL